MKQGRGTGLAHGGGVAALAETPASRQPGGAGQWPRARRQGMELA
jgi:hypothetical protein